MKLLTRTLMIASLALAAVTQAQAADRHDRSATVKHHGSQHEVVKVTWTARANPPRSYRGKTIHHHYTKPLPHHHYQPRKQYRHRYDRPVTRHYYYGPGHRYNSGRSSGTLIFRW